MSERQQRLAETLASIDDAVITADERGIVTYMNPAARAFAGCRSERELGTLADTLARVSPALAVAVCRAVGEVSATGASVHRACTLPNEDGGDIDIEHSVSALRDSAGRQTGVVVVLHDVSVLTRANRRLLAEIRDRVNNNLQSIQGMLGIQAERMHEDRYAELFRDWQERIFAMALVYQYLDATSDLAHVDLQGYLRRLATHLHRNHGETAERIALRLAVNELELGADTAILVGLLLIELLSNALRHGFPDGRAGTVLVELRALGGGVAELRVTDDGVGLPASIDPRTADSFGFELVRGIGESSLGGQLSVGVRRGTTVAIQFPIESAKSRAATARTHASTVA